MAESAHDTGSVYHYKDDKSDDVPPLHLFVPILYITVFIIGMIGNILVLCFTFKFKYEDGFIWKCIFHMALADILFLTSLPFLAYDVLSEWIFGRFMCHTVTALTKMGLYGNVFFMVLIAVERYMSLFCNIHVRRITTLKACCFMWTLSLLASLPDIIFRHETNWFRQRCAYDFPSRVWSSFTFLNSILLSFVIPLIITVFCYSRVSCKMFQHVLRRESDLDQQRRMPIRYITILAVVVVYFLFLAPYNIVSFHVFLLESADLQTAVVWGMFINWLWIFACCRCCLNPIIYVIFEPNFRNNMFKICSVRHGCCTTSSDEVTDRELDVL